LLLLNPAVFSHSVTEPNAFTWVFLAALAVATAMRLWLAARQIRHVRAHRDAVPAAFADSIPLAAHQKAADYSVAKTRLAVADLVVGVVLLLALTFGGLIEWLAQAWARAFAPGGIAHGAALILSVVVLVSVIELPLSIYRTFAIEARFGFNRMTPRLFAADLARQALVAALLGVPLLVLVLWLMAKTGAQWWIWVWLAWTGFNLLVLLIYPSFVAPLFNKFSPLQDPALAGRIEALLARCGFRSSGLYVMDGSKRSSHGNAYFTGFGAAKRIVLFDTLLARLAPAEVEAVLAHELGHYRRHHVWKRVLVLFAVSFALLWVLGRLIGESWFYAGLGVAAQSAASALLLFVLVTPVFLFFFQPLMSLVSRRHEFEADAYAAAHSSAAELVKALVKLYQDNAATLTPDPLHSAFYDSHPPAAARISRLAAGG
jgi:STE24 endopeptidase